MPRASRFATITQITEPSAGGGVGTSSDETFTVPAGHVWGLGSIAATLVSSAVAGNRQIDVLITDGSDNIVAKYSAGAVQAASVTRTYVFAPQHPQETGFTNGLMLRALAAGLQIPVGYKVRVYDSAAIDTTNDALTVRILSEDMAE
jgi:hypothetical protein